MKINQIAEKAIQSTEAAKTRQLCSGFIYEGTEENRVTIRFPHNQELVEVEDIVTELPPDSKIVIFHSFQ